MSPKKATSSVMKITKSSTAGKLANIGWKGSIYLNNFSIILNDPIPIPIIHPKLENPTTSNILKTRFFHKPEIFIPVVDVKSSVIVSKSLTVGFLIIASIKPETHPVAIPGWIAAIGAIRPADSIDKGCARAIVAPIAAHIPVDKHQTPINDNPAW